MWKLPEESMGLIVASALAVSWVILFLIIHNTSKPTGGKVTKDT